MREKFEHVITALVEEDPETIEKVRTDPEFKKEYIN